MVSPQLYVGGWYRSVSPLHRKGFFLGGIFLLTRLRRNRFTSNEIRDTRYDIVILSASEESQFTRYEILDTLFAILYPLTAILYFLPLCLLLLTSLPLASLRSLLGSPYNKWGRLPIFPLGINGDVYLFSLLEFGFQ